jgi:hypothetical protein
MMPFRFNPCVTCCCEHCFRCTSGTTPCAVEVDFETNSPFSDLLCTNCGSFNEKFVCRQIFPCVWLYQIPSPVANCYDRIEVRTIGTAPFPYYIEVVAWTTPAHGPLNLATWRGLLGLPPVDCGFSSLSVPIHSTVDSTGCTVDITKDVIVTAL